MSLKNWGLLFLLSAIWGGSFFFNGVLVQQLEPLTITFGRTLLAAIALNIVIVAQGQRMPTQLAIWGAFAVMGLLNNMIPFSLIAFGQKSIDSGLASIFNATMPLFSVMLGHFFTSDEKLTWNKLLGVVLGIIGVIVLIGPQALQSIGAQTIGQLAVLGAAFSYAVAAIFGRRFRGLPPLIPAAGMLTCSALLSLPFAVFMDRFYTVTPTAATIWAMLGLAIVSTAVAYILYFTILSSAGATNISLVTLLIPLTALVLGVLFLDETITTALMIGMLLIFSGLLAVDGRVFRRT